MNIDETASVVSQVDFEGFLEEVNCAIGGGGESSGAEVGEREVAGGEVAGGCGGDSDAARAH